MPNYSFRDILAPSWPRVSQLTQKPVQLDHVQLEVLNETVDIEEMAHQSHQAVSYNTHTHKYSDIKTQE